MATEVIYLAEHAGDKALALTGHTWCLTALLELGDMAAVEHAAAAVTQLATELQQPFYRWWSMGLRVMRALLEGRFAEVEPLAEQALLVGQRVQAADALQAFGAQMATLRGEQGRLHELAPAIQAFAEQHATVPAWQGALAHLHAGLGQHEEARRAFERLAAHRFTDLPRDQQWLTTLVLLAEVCAFLGDTACAVMLYEMLLPHAARNVVVGPAVACYGSVSRTLGLLATTLARWDEAARHFADALAMNVRMGARPFVARTQYEYACMLLTRDSSGDRARALNLLASAVATTRELGMTSLQSKVESLQSKVQSGGVSSREPEADRQRAAGRRQQQTADTQHSGLSTEDFTQLFRKEGAYWTLSSDSTTVRLRDMKGLHYIAYLLQHPGREVHVVDLLALTDKRPARLVSAGLSPAQLAEQGLHVSGSAETPALPDAQARAAYRRRLEDLQEELAEAERYHDPTRATKARAEIEFITTELAAAYGLGGHARKSDGAAEKVRKAVTNRIRAALVQIRKAHPALWQHLFRALKTGTFCSYNPEQPVTWRV